MVDPVTTGIAAGTSLLSGLLRGGEVNRQMTLQAELANQQIKEQRRNQFQNLIAARDANLGGQRYGYELDKSAKEYGARFLGPVEDWRTAQFALRGASTSLDPLMRIVSQEGNKKNLNQSLEDRTAAVRTMFGGSAEEDRPFTFGRMPSYAFSI